MPFYACFTAKGAVSPETKAEIAKEITRIHVEATGAPAAFVNVFFLDLPPASRYVAGTPKEDGALIMGNIRAGRDLETRQKILKSLSAAWSRLTGQREQDLILNVSELDAATIMEAGLIVPRPGEEAAWIAAK